MIFQSSDDVLDVTILVLPGSSLMSLAATLDPMRGANRILDRQLYRWRVISIDGKPPVTSSGLAIPVEAAFAPNEVQGVLVILGGFDVFRHATARFLRAVRSAAKHSLAVGGIEAGAWILGLAGLLEGRAATTHWEDLEAFAARFSQVEVKPDRWVIDGPVFTTGGATPALDFVLALIRARQGYSIALDVASLFVYDDVKAASDAQPIVSLGSINRSEPRLAQAIRTMESHIDRPLAIAAIARRIPVSVRTLEGLFRRTLGTSPGAYYLALRLKAARRLIVDTGSPLADVAERSGFCSISTLSRAYKSHFGHVPSKARLKGR